jgi:putative hydrolase of the HAD superfamily
MSEIKAVFFDRDNTLTCKNEDAYKKYYELVESISHKPFEMDRKRMFEVFAKIKARGFNTNTYDNEVEFYKEYYKQVLIEECGNCNEEVAKQIFDVMWLKDRVLFNDVIDTFKEIKGKGLKIGIISDTTLSLQKTLEALDVGEYIDCYTSSKEVGVMKPEPEIYLKAIAKLGLKPEECIYVDDYDEEVVGALNLGFIGFRINRSDEDKRDFDISSLKEVINYLNKVR